MPQNKECQSHRKYFAVSISYSCWKPNLFGNCWALKTDVPIIQSTLAYLFKYINTIVNKVEMFCILENEKRNDIKSYCQQKHYALNTYIYNIINIYPKCCLNVIYCVKKCTQNVHIISVEPHTERCILEFMSTSRLATSSFKLLTCTL